MGARGRGGRETHRGEGEGELGAEGGVGVEQGEVLFEKDVDFGRELLGGHGCGGHCGREVVVVVIGSVAYGGRAVVVVVVVVADRPRRDSDSDSDGDQAEQVATPRRSMVQGFNCRSG